MDRISVAVISGPNELGLSLVENLISSFCSVKVFTKEIGKWRLITSHIKNSIDFNIFNEGELANNVFGYFVYVYLSKEGDIKNKILEIENGVMGAKGIFIFSYHSLPKEEKKILKPQDNETIIFIGDLIGPRINLEEDKPISKIFKAALSKRKTEIKINPILYPVFIPDATKIIVKWLFSFGPYGESVLLLSGSVSILEIISYLNDYLGKISFEYTPDEEAQISKFGMRKFTLNTNVATSIKETLLWFLNYDTEKFQEKTPQIFGWKKGATIFLLILFLLSPFFTTLISSLSLLLVKGEVLRSKFSETNILLVLTKETAGFSKYESSYFSLIPIVGPVYRQNMYISSLIFSIADIGEEGLAVYKLGADLGNKIFGDSVYDPEPYAQNLNLRFDSLYKKISSLQGELEKAPDINKLLIEKVLKDVALSQLKDITLNVGGLTKQLPQLVGAGKAVSYLVLLQNNMELRPTGGFIGSYALVTFDGGRMTNVDIQDVYNADGQLKGHVEPPNPIKNYLGESSWYLRDSNWDPDFSISAQRAGWFLDKEVDKSVDGVVAVDLQLVKSLLLQFGPISLKDFGIQIDQNNLYQKTQSEVESNFFPGSTKKRTFLTALARELLAKTTNFDEKNFLPVAKDVFSSLLQKHVQIFLHDKDAEKAIESLGWDGGVSTPVCASTNCFPDWIGMVEANVGVNKANFFIKRNAQVSISLDNQEIKRKLNVFLENTSGRSQNTTNKYKVYLRVLIPTASNLESADLVNGLNKESLSPDVNDIGARKEIGVLLEVPPGEKRELQFVWKGSHNLDFKKQGEFRFYWRKQAGTNEDPVLVNLNLPQGVAIKGETHYNTTLARDFFSRVSW